MVPLTALWLPILVSAVIVFIGSTLLWMALPFWHGRDYKRLPDEKPFVDGAKSLASGQYIFPWMDWKNATPEKKAEIATLPGGYMIIRNPNAFSFPKALLLHFLSAVLVSVFVAYLTGHALAAGTHYLTVFRIAGTAGVLGWAFGNFGDSIWYGKPWIVTIKQSIDGLAYGLLIGGTFGWLWPR